MKKVLKNIYIVLMLLSTVFVAFTVLKNKYRTFTYILILIMVLSEFTIRAVKYFKYKTVENKKELKIYCLALVLAISLLLIKTMVLK